MNNALYGKTMENLRNRINVKLARNKKDYLKFSSAKSKYYDNSNKLVVGKI